VYLNWFEQSVIMGKILFEIEIPEGMDEEVKSAVKELLEVFIRETKFSIAKNILKESRLTEEQAMKLAKEVNLSVAKKHLKE